MIKLNDELSLVNKKFEKVKKDNEEMKNKINYYENIINESIFKHLENIDILKNKIFLLENSIVKKDNMIYNLNVRVNDYIEREEYNDFYNPHEIYVYNLFLDLLINLSFFLSAYKFLNLRILKLKTVI